MRAKLKLACVLEIIEVFRLALEQRETEEQVTRLTETTRAQLAAFQGSWQERPYLARSLCQVSAALRQAGWPQIALDMLSRPDVMRIADAYLFTEMVQGHLAKGTYESAECLVQLARRHGHISACAYSLMIKAHCRRGDVTSAQRLFDCASQDGLASQVASSPLILGLAHAGRVDGAREVYVRASEQERRDVGERPFMTSVVCNALLSAYEATGQLQSALEVFEEGRSHGAADAPSFATMIRLYVRHGRLEEARRTFAMAKRSGRVNSDVVASIKLLSGSRQRATRMLRSSVATTESRGIARAS